MFEIYSAILLTIMEEEVEGNQPINCVIPWNLFTFDLFNDYKICAKICMLFQKTSKAEVNRKLVYAESIGCENVKSHNDGSTLWQSHYAVGDR